MTISLVAQGAIQPATTAPVSSEKMTTSLAIGNPQPAAWLRCWGYSAWFAALSLISTVVPSQTRTRRPHHCCSGRTCCSNCSAVSGTKRCRSSSGNRWRALRSCSRICRGTFGSCCTQPGYHPFHGVAQTFVRI